MKWINLCIKKLPIISTQNCPQFNTTTVILHKSKKISGSQGKNMILKCLCPHVGCVAP